MTTKIIPPTPTFDEPDDSLAPLGIHAHLSAQIADELRAGDLSFVEDVGNPIAGAYPGVRYEGADLWSGLGSHESKTHVNET